MSDKKNIWLTVQTVLLLVIVFQLVSISNSIPAGFAVADAQPSPTQAIPSAPTPSANLGNIADDDAFKGEEDAPITIVEFSDFECPFCNRFYTQTLSQIEEKYINTGKVKFVYRDFPLGFHQNAQKAAEAAECAEEQDKFWEMHDILFEKGVTGGVSSFKQYATDLGLDTAEFNTCLDTGKYASEVQADFAAGQAAGVTGTPAFFVNGKKLVGAQPFSVFEQAIEDALR